MEMLFYLAQVLGGLHTLFGVILGISMGVAIFVTIGLLIEMADGDAIVDEGVKKWIFRLWLIAFVSAIFNIFIPTKETFLFMVGGYAVDKVIENNPEVKEIPGNTIDLLNEYIKAQTEKVRETSKEK